MRECTQFRMETEALVRRAEVREAQCLSSLRIPFKQPSLHVPDF
uniref:Uncharacterized protein n=1 Tax=Anguilla anguilla TaxID=7936 RepID=A0A0E9R1F2_ANGAN